MQGTDRVPLSAVGSVDPALTPGGGVVGMRPPRSAEPRPNEGGLLSREVIWFLDFCCVLIWGPNGQAPPAARIIGVLTVPAHALDPAEQARWQAAANQARVTLLAPETPGYVLQEVRGRSLTRGGDTLGQAFATWSSPDGRTLQLAQGRRSPAATDPSPQ